MEIIKQNKKKKIEKFLFQVFQLKHIVHFLFLS